MFSFFGSLVTFDFVTDVPSESLIVGSVIFSEVMSMLSLGYELRRCAEAV